VKLFPGIRGRLAVNTVAAAALMAALAAGFVVTFWRVDQSLTAMYEVEIRPQRHLDQILQRLDEIQLRMQGLLLGRASTDGAADLLDAQWLEIETLWGSFRDAHPPHAGSDEEAALMREIDDGLFRLAEFVASLRPAYRRADLPSVAKLLEYDWFEVELNLLDPFRQLVEAQDRHAQASYEKMRRERAQAGLFFGCGLLAILAIVVLGNARVARYVNRRIAVIERSLRGILRGEQTIELSFARGEQEMERIATAIRAAVAHLVEDQRRIEELTRIHSAVLDSTAEGIYGVDTTGRIIFANRACQAMLGFPDEELLGEESHRLFHHHRPDGSPYPATECLIYRARIARQTVQCADEVFFRKDGESLPVEYTATPMTGNDGDWIGTVVVFRDISIRLAQERMQRELVESLRTSNAKLQQLHGQLLQSEKLASIGQLAAGVAHEINNPVGFVNSNLGSLQSYVQTLLGLLEPIEAAARHDAMPDAAVWTEWRTRIRAAELEFLRQDLADLIRESREGLERVKKIVLDLKSFARLDAGDWQAADLNAGLESTLNVVWNELKYKAEVIRDYGELPPVNCHLGKLNQVFMNLLVNAGQAIGERGTITVRTTVDGDDVLISVADTGCGIPPEHLPRIFDPFFTSKPVGKGTGLGLALAWGIVRDHGGTIGVESVVGAGTTFTVRVPIAGRPADAEARPA
jgi:PAS domain S-box-containing protein